MKGARDVDSSKLFLCFLCFLCFQENAKQTRNINIINVPSLVARMVKGGVESFGADVLEDGVRSK